jgi:hypothetical protein
MSSFLDELERVGFVDGVSLELGEGGDHHARLQVLLIRFPVITFFL